MSKFQTIVEIPEYDWKAGYNQPALFMGSCFTENIGQKMLDLKFPADINPFGILYNPMSVSTGLQILVNQKTFTKSDLVMHNGLWHSFQHHGMFSSSNQDEVLNAINSRIYSSGEFFKKAGFLFITFGTAWIYRLKRSEELVSNCHKIPAGEFFRERLSVNEIVLEYRELLDKVWEFNPEVKVVFTVSPIRHWKDGAIENQRSKATLLLAVDEIITEFGAEKCAYFPSYEIVMDELRDYRFYANDMLHLSEMSIQHIWEKFQVALIDPKSIKTVKQVKKIIQAVNHRPLKKDSVEFVQFLERLLKNISELESAKPYLNLKLEKEYFKTQIDEYGKSR
jgi:hypothetical protein